MIGETIVEIRGQAISTVVRIVSPRTSRLEIGAFLLLMVGLVVSFVHPRRGIPDLIAGTRLMPS